MDRITDIVLTITIIIVFLWVVFLAAGLLFVAATEISKCRREVK
jgi:hypothetical protein